MCTKEELQMQIRKPDDSLQQLISDLNKPEVEDFYYGLQKFLGNSLEYITDNDYDTWFLYKVVMPERDKKLQNFLKSNFKQNILGLLPVIESNLTEDTRVNLLKLLESSDKNMKCAIYATINNLYLFNNFKGSLESRGSEIKDEEVDDFIRQIIGLLDKNDINYSPEAFFKTHDGLQNYIFVEKFESAIDTFNDKKDIIVEIKSLIEEKIL